ncbi:HsdM Type I restriction-modification system methyltransferase subunit [Candidatus Methylopumilus planktonicus]|uniref:N-6 DNA methylase n=1 Tax=Candidatus Methylopumilus planktonicus TaxID=1581557 RepID=UPI003BEF3A10
MLNEDTKKKIDTARQILVGKVPDPKAQVGQITTALMYKFMDDKDKEAEEIGGKASFFTKGYEKYSWTNLLDSKISGQDRLNIYIESLSKLNQNPNLPQLFRDIFKDASLPYRDPETLNLFLKEINGFKYEHSEDLGDAFEYLLSILGSQGDAGQFRTPRHIIDFIVAIVDPKKHETVLDPACGTSGFLISTYKHILKENKNTPLTPDEKKKLMSNLVGYDISPDMVLLSRVNMYLHGFPSPNIDEYDSLTSEEKWEENFDVIIANPPFMTPKGGIKPHKKFSIKTRRAEALFVDYLIEHLNVKGKAGVIVPDGIVNNKNFTSLRKFIIDNGLYAVISLHQYVFKPYAGAKTSILFFDKSFKTSKTLFAEIDNDGFQKGVQRGKIDFDDLPELSRLIKDFKSSPETINLKTYKLNAKIEDLNSLDKKIYFHYVDQLTLFPNTFIYKNTVALDPRKSVRISEIFNIKKGVLQSTKATPGEYRFVTASDEISTHEEYTHDTEALVVAVAAGGSLGKVQYVHEKFIASDLCFVLTPKKKNQSDLLFYFYYLKSIRANLVQLLAKGVSKQSINKKDFENLLIDFFSYEKQSEIGKAIRASRDKISAHEKAITEIEDALILDINQIRKNSE